ncbi:hypothetical protein IWQ60_005312 [Tieghemiomyces parasiticus]|uniref:Uncharacterized protein n=1 Tax=Tieghemiomyces parasiticus TaxID=78921 RepID=A0A9W8A9W5_9FUNG|nr:hypothetical protein IWQ60_005312 [Tieghemiomyces parasiticus]
MLRSPPVLPAVKDTERIYTEVTEEILTPLGCTFGWDTKIKLMGRTTHDSIRTLLEETSAPISHDDYYQKSRELQLAKFHTCRPLPGVERLIRHLKNSGVPIAVGTSSTETFFKLKTQENQDLFTQFDTITCGDDPNVKLGKPHPDIFVEAQRRLGNPPASQCLVFEDALNGVKAALRAGMHVVWIPDVNVVQLGLPEDHGAIEVITSMADFNPEKYGLPPFNDVAVSG